MLDMELFNIICLSVIQILYDAYVSSVLLPSVHVHCSDLVSLPIFFGNYDMFMFVSLSLSNKHYFLIQFSFGWIFLQIFHAFDVDSL